MCVQYYFVEIQVEMTVEIHVVEMQVKTTVVVQPHHYTKDKLSTGLRRECKDGIIDDNTISICM